MIMHQLDARIRKMREVISSLVVRAERNVEGIGIAPRGTDRFEPFENGSHWALEEGENWQDFRFTCTVPEDFYGQVRLCEATGMDGWEATMSQIVVWVNGRIEQAFDTRHLSLVLQEKAKPGETFEIFLQAYHNTQSNKAGRMPPRMRLYLADYMDDVQQLYYDIDVPYQAAMLEKNGCRDRELTLQTLSDAVNLLDLRRPYSAEFHESVAACRKYLKENYYDAVSQIAPEAVADCIGHTHIDVAWLWDIYQTRHKAVRTFATMLKLMERYPEFKFMSSQAQLYQFVKEDQPELFGRIRKAVKDGSWEAEGGMWVEADCNLSGGEALVRQFLYGNEFFEKELGVRSRVLWLPDVFGYSAALPQILKKSGIDYFMTSKLSWSEFNLSPYDTFMWKGIDGSEVLTHFTPSREYGAEDDYERHDDLKFFTTYNAMLEPNQIKGGWKRFQQKGMDNHYLVSYGFGDGGGGSTEWMIENARRMAAPVAGCPAVRQTFARDFFEQMEKRVQGNKRLPKWSGELYLEYHRGTYTSQGKNKKNNRKLEIALRDAEFWLTKAGVEYPQDELRLIWRSMLTLQFHDILPGSSIHKVYEDSDKTYAELFERVGALKARAMDALSADAEGDVLLTNTLSEERNDIVWFDGPEGVSALKDKAGNTYPAQRVEGRYAAYVAGIPAMGAKSAWFVFGPEAPARLHADENGFETPFFTGRFDAAMHIESLVDKAEQRELVKPGKALNRIVYYENRPHNYDAWDINIYYDEHSWPVDEPVSVERISEGPVMSVLRVTWKTGDSTVKEDLRFYADVKRVDFVADIDWREPHGLLKAHFPLDIFYNQAQFDIQYGNVTRATHKNTSWDVARFEVCAHKWADVSEAAYGAAVMSDCKYGYSVDENGVALSLLKSATHPDPTADIGRHVFAYSLMPHAGTWREAAVPARAYEFNIPAEAVRLSGSGSREAGFSFARTDRPNVIVETVKAALHGEGTIVRMYECYGARTKAVLRLEKAPKEAQFTSLMEDDLGPAPFAGNELAYEFKPYEIVTIWVK
ncbi:MAG: alpha-mannosidase [Clostridia bacterium]|nr:alpha-mannosidase [Clostridia bacterium]